MIKKIWIDIIDDQYDYVKRRLNFYYVKRRFDSIKVDYIRKVQVQYAKGLKRKLLTFQP